MIGATTVVPGFSNVRGTLEPGGRLAFSYSVPSARLHLDADGVYHPTWSPAGRDPKVDPPGKKAEARRLTRVRRLRYYPVRIVDGLIEIAIPVSAEAAARL